MNWLSLASISVWNFSQTRLIVRTIRNWDQFTILFLRWIPTFKIEFSDCSVIKFSWNNINDLIWNLKRLIKLLADLKHSLHLIIALLRMTNDKLFNFLKLMNSKKSMNIFSMCTCLFSETRWVSTHFYRKLFRLNYLTFVISS